MNELVVTRGERTRAEIVDTAYHLFLEQGYHGTSIRQIARGAGIAVGGRWRLYNHFPGKEEIYLAVHHDYHPYRGVVPAMNNAQVETLEEFVRDAASRMVDAIGERKDFMNVMFIELVEFNGQHFLYLHLAY